MVLFPSLSLFTLLYLDIGVRLQNFLILQDCVRVYQSVCELQTAIASLHAYEGNKSQLLNDLFTTPLKVSNELLIQLATSYSVSYKNETYDSILAKNCNDSSYMRIKFSFEFFYKSEHRQYIW